jgi:hypothetical protein
MKLDKQILTSGKAITLVLALTLFFSSKINGQTISKENIQNSKESLATQNCRIERQSIDLIQVNPDKKQKLNNAVPATLQRVTVAETENVFQKEQLPYDANNVNKSEINALPANSKKN